MARGQSAETSVRVGGVAARKGTSAPRRKSWSKRPFRVHIDPSQDGAEVVNGVADRVRREMFRNIGLANLLSPRANG